MSATRYLRALPLPPHLLPLHYHVLRTLGIKGPLSTAELYDTLEDTQKHVSWRQPSIKRNPARMMRDQELDQLTERFGELAVNERQQVTVDVTRSFFKSKIISPLRLSGAIQPRRLDATDPVKDTSKVVSPQQRMKDLKKLQERMRFGFYVNWQKFPELAKNVQAERKALLDAGETPYIPPKTKTDEEDALPRAKPLTPMKHRAILRKEAKIKEKHTFVLPPQGGKRPARRRQEIWAKMREFNKRGEKYFETTGIWGEGRPIPKGFR